MITRRHALGAGGLTLLLAACQSAPPPRRIPEDGTIDMLTLLRSKPEHSRYVNALVVSGAAARIGRANGAVTLFVPANEAMNALPAATLALLDSPPAQPSEAQRQQIGALVFANAAWGLLRLGDIAARRNTVVTWDRARLVVTPSGERTARLAREGVTLAANTAPPTILRADVLASDGVFHVTSGLIIP